ncbi:hypothetical protein ACHWQZ_G006122 [Mnemiopsis leidyi]
MKKDSVRETLQLLRKLQSEPHESGYSGYAEYYPGSEDSCIILTAPHGGNIKPDVIPDRCKTCCNNSVPGCKFGQSKYSVSLVRDTFTLEMAITLRSELSAMLGERPHLVICNLNRRKLDVNRDLDNGAQHNPHAERAWRDYHAFIKLARGRVARNCGRGVIFDIHGQSHPEKLVELGYALSSDQLHSIPHPEHSSIRCLCHCSKYRFENILRGPQSLGARLNMEGFISVPSPLHPTPPAKYYSGGYTVQEWGSSRCSTVDAIQLELPYHVREAYKRTGVVIASVLADFITDMYILNTCYLNMRQSQVSRRCFSQLFWDFVERLLYI